MKYGILFASFSVLFFSACEPPLSDSSGNVPGSAENSSVVAQFCRWLALTRTLSTDSASYRFRAGDPEQENHAFNEATFHVNCGRPVDLEVFYSRSSSRTTVDTAGRETGRNSVSVSSRFAIPSSGDFEIPIVDRRRNPTRSYGTVVGEEHFSVEGKIKLKVESVMICSQSYGRCETESISSDLEKNRLQIKLKSTRTQYLESKRKNPSSRTEEEVVTLPPFVITLNLFVDRISISTTSETLGTYIYPFWADSWPRSPADLL